MIYFVQPIEGGLIKIGVSRSLSVRKSQLQAKAGCKLSVLGVCRGGFSDERAIHEKFAGLRRDGEWFEPHQELLEFIAENAVKWNGYDDVDIIFQMRGSEAFKTWLRGLADYDATDTTEVVERALAAYARTIGYAEPRPKR